MTQAQNIDLVRIAEEIAHQQRHVDALETLAAAGTALGQAQRDALQTASARIDNDLAFLFSIAERVGVDFLTIPVGSYDLCYALEASRWEGFVSNFAAV